MDQGLHGALHLRALWRDHLVIVDRHRARCLRQKFAALFHQMDGLAHLFHADEIAVIAVAVLSDRHVEFEFVVALVGLALAQVPGCAGAADHHTTHAPGPGRPPG